ncbi:MAG: hypothetical protein H0X59_03850 [Chloroflexi bacterium]|nr:hypothetical protein [Chloroflexota bacterium]
MRPLLLWAGIVLFGLIAFTAALQAIGELGVAASRLGDPVVRTGSLLTVMFLVSVAGLVVVVARAAPSHYWLAIALGLAVVLAVRLLVAFPDRRSCRP